MLDYHSQRGVCSAPLGSELQDAEGELVTGSTRALVEDIVAGEQLPVDAFTKRLFLLAPQFQQIQV